MTRALAVAAAALALLAGGAQGAVVPGLAFAPTGAVNGWIGAATDFNGDAKPDLAVVNASRIAGFLDGMSGRFTAATTGSVATGVQPVAVTTGDFNGDGHADLALERNDSQTGAGSIVVALGDGSGGFHVAPDTSAVAIASSSLIPGDFNGDGKLDLVAGNRVLLGDGAGRFTAGTTLAGSALAAADLNGDKKTDVVAAVGKSVSILLGDGAGTFHAATGSPVGLGRVPVSVATGDFNKDGHLDLAVAAGPATNILLGDGRGGFRQATGSPIAITSGSLATGDFDGDGKLDIAASCTCGVMLLLGDGKGGFRSSSVSQEPTDAILAAKDVNGDGRLDLITSHDVRFQTAAGPTSARAAPLTATTLLSTTLPVTRLAADGAHVAAVTSPNSSPCSEPRGQRLVVWASVHRPAQRLATTTCVDELALGAGRLAWIERACGNSCDLTVKVVPLGGTKPKAVDFVDNGNGAGEDPDGGYLGHLLGGGTTLAFNSWVVCDPNNPDRLGQACPAKDPATGLATERLVRVAPTPTTILKSGASAYRLVATGGGRFAVTAGGTLAIVAPNGKATCSATTSAISPHGVALTQTTLVVESPLTLDLYDATTCAKKRSIPLGPAAQLPLSGATSQLALLSEFGRLVLVRLSDGKQIALPVAGAVDAKLTDAGLFYAYDTPKRRLQGHVVFAPTASLLQRF